MMCKAHCNWWLFFKSTNAKRPEKKMKLLFPDSVQANEWARVLFEAHNQTSFRLWGKKVVSLVDVVRLPYKYCIKSTSNIGRCSSRQKPFSSGCTCSRGSWGNNIHEDSVRRYIELMILILSILLSVFLGFFTDCSVGVDMNFLREKRFRELSVVWECHKGHGDRPFPQTLYRTGPDPFPFVFVGAMTYLAISNLHSWKGFYFHGSSGNERGTGRRTKAKYSRQPEVTGKANPFLLRTVPWLLCNGVSRLGVSRFRLSRVNTYRNYLKQISGNVSLSRQKIGTIEARKKMV